VMSSCGAAAARGGASNEAGVATPGDNATAGAGTGDGAGADVAADSRFGRTCEGVCLTLAVALGRGWGLGGASTMGPLESPDPSARARPGPS
jgi:hypothetical protein